jgi:exopolyphosphatase/guanosine-5'-triphosphate,3'-diphosphate pyrophosphatase
VRISKAQLSRLYENLSRRNLEDRRLTPGIGPRRAEVIIAGCAVLRRVLDDFKLPSLYYSRAGLRDGLIADLAQEDAEARSSRLDDDRRRVVRELARHYGVPLRHADKVAAMAVTLFESLQPLHELPGSAGRYLEAAAYLHDIGHFVSDSRHHKHSYYLVANSDLAGFTARERMLVANLCRYHRKALPSANHDNFKALTDDDKRMVERLVPALRLADSLDRSREQRVSDVRVRVRRSRVELQLVAQEEVDLEQWAAQQVEGAFQQMYDRRLVVLQNGA